MPRPKCFCHSRLTMTRAVSGLSGEAIQLGQGEAPARGAAVGPRDLGGRIAAGDRPARTRAASAGRGSRRRRGSGNTTAASRSVRDPCAGSCRGTAAESGTSGSSPPRRPRRAARSDGRRRWRCRPSAAAAAARSRRRRAAGVRSRSGRELGRRQRRVELLRRHAHRLEHLDRQQPLARGPRALGLGGGLVDGVGEARLDQRQLETVAVRLLDGGDLRPEPVAPGVERLVGRQVGGGLLAAAPAARWSRRSRRSTPAARSSPSAGSDRTCGRGSARSRSSAPACPCRSRR